jgi:15-cis-phytoene desaturase
MRENDVLIIGSGLAGLCCAFELAERGRRVTVLEASDVIGGRTASWVQDGMPVESGLHKFLGIYRTLPAILRRAGIDLSKMLTWVDELAIHMPDGGGTFSFGAAPYRRPLKTLLGALGNGELIPFKEKRKLARMLLAGLRDLKRDPSALDRVSVAQYARRRGVSEETVANVLQTATAAILFLPADEFSMYAAMSPLGEALKGGMTMGVGAFNGGMTDVMMTPLAEAIMKRGGEVRTGARVTGLRIRHGRIEGVETDAGPIEATAVVLATALHAAQGLVGAAVGDHPWFQPMLRLKGLSSVTAQFELEGPCQPTDRTNFSATALCCFGEQSRTTFKNLPGRLSAILYPPEQFLDAADQEVWRTAVREARRIGISLEGTMGRFRCVRHPHDFYRMEPGSEVLRPNQATPIEGFFLAGDYTKQPWSASMEGAALSGVLAAEAIAGKR